MAITVDSFQRAADLDLSGALEIKGENVKNLGTTTTLGTLGNQIVRFFQTIGAFLGICQKPPSEQERQAKAINAFREALTKQYGAKIAQDVTQNLTGRLTGMQVRGVIKSAEGQIQANARENEKQVALRLPGEYIEYPLTKDVVLRNKAIDSSPLKGMSKLELLYKPLKKQQDAMEDFKQLCRSLDIQDPNFISLFDPKDNERPDNAHTLYREMLRGYSFVGSRGNTQTLNEYQAGFYAMYILNSMQEIKNKDGILKASSAFQNFTRDIQNLLSQLANGCEKKDILEGVARIKSSAGEFLASLLIVDESRLLFSAAIGKAFSELPKPEQKALRDQLVNWTVAQNPFMNAYGIFYSREREAAVLSTMLMEIVGNDGKGHVDGKQSLSV